MKPIARGRRCTRLVAGLFVSAVLTSCASSAAGQTHGAPQFTGYKWRVTEVRQGTTTVKIPARMRTTIAFDKNGQLLADDGVNSYSGSYTLTSSGYRTGDIAGSLVGYVGHDATTLASIQAIQAIAASRRSVSARLAAGGLTLSATPYTVTLVNAGSVARSPASASPTPTRTP